jgi:hypothetical protein
LDPVFTVVNWAGSQFSVRGQRLRPGSISRVLSRNIFANLWLNIGSCLSSDPADCFGLELTQHPKTKASSKKDRKIQSTHP